MDESGSHNHHPALMDSELLCHFWFLQRVLWLFTLTARSKFSALCVVNADTSYTFKLNTRKKTQLHSPLVSFSRFNLSSPLLGMLNLLPLSLLSQSHSARGLRESHYSYTCGKKQAIYIDCSGQYKPAGLLIFSLYEVVILLQDC